MLGELLSECLLPCSRGVHRGEMGLQLFLQLLGCGPAVGEHRICRDLPGRLESIAVLQDQDTEILEPDLLKGALKLLDGFQAVLLEVLERRQAQVREALCDFEVRGLEVPSKLHEDLWGALHVRGEIHEPRHLKAGPAEEPPTIEGRLLPLHYFTTSQAQESEPQGILITYMQESPATEFDWSGP